MMKLAIVLAAVILSVSLVACGSRGNNADNGGGNSNSSGTGNNGSGANSGSTNGGSNSSNSGGSGGESSGYSDGFKAGYEDGYRDAVNGDPHRYDGTVGDDLQNAVGDIGDAVGDMGNAVDDALTGDNAADTPADSANNGTFGRMLDNARVTDRDGRIR